MTMQMLKQQETKQKKAGNHGISILNTPITPNQDELDILGAKRAMLDMNLNVSTFESCLKSMANILSTICDQLDDDDDIYAGNLFS